MTRMNRVEIIAVIKECTAKLGHAPSQTELKNATGLMPWHINKAFGTYGRALKACGLERTGSGYTVDRRTMFVAWAETVRKLGKVPTAYEYEENSKCYSKTLAKWCGTWRSVPNCLLEYMRNQQLEDVSDAATSGTSTMERPTERRGHKCPCQTQDHL